MSLSHFISLKQPIEPNERLTLLIQEKELLQRQNSALATINYMYAETIENLNKKVSELEKNDKLQMEELFRLRKLEAFGTLK